MSKKLSNSSFTLIELSIVIALIGLLVAIIITFLVEIPKKSRDIHRITEIHQIQKALFMYYHFQFGNYPEGENDGGGWDFGNIHLPNNLFIEPLEKAGYFTKTPREIYFPAKEQTYRYALYKNPPCGKNFYLLMAKLERPQVSYRLEDQIHPCLEDFPNIKEVVEGEDWYAVMGVEE